MKAIIASLLLASACASSGIHGGGVGASPSASLLTVQNEQTENLTIYIVRSGWKGRRLGEVNSFGSATFALTDADAPIASDIQFLAATFASSGHSVLSDPVTVQRGATYHWRLASARGHDVITAAYAGR